MKEKILILGGTQFVGRRLVEILQTNPAFELTLFNRGITNPDLFPDLQKITGERNGNDIEQISAYDWDYIIDFSCYYPDYLRKTLTCLKPGLKKYIFISTISTYSFKDYDSSFEIPEDYLLHECSAEEEMDTSTRTYGKRKVACEQALLSAQDLPSVILRPSIIYGPYDHTDRFYYWLYKIKNQQPIILPDSGEHQLSLTYSEDLAQIIINSLQATFPTGIYNCSTHSPLSLREMFELAAKVMNLPFQPFDIPQDWLLEEKVKMQQDLPLWTGRSLTFDNTKLKAVLKSPLLDFETSLQQSLQWHEERAWPVPGAGINTEQAKETIERYKSTNPS